jgi:hypothetical protein
MLVDESGQPKGLLARLPPSAWNGHLHLLRKECPTWSFQQGFKGAGLAAA